MAGVKTSGKLLRNLAEDYVPEPGLPARVMAQVRRKQHAAKSGTGAYGKPERKSTHPSGDLVVDFRDGPISFYFSLNENRVREMVFELEDPEEE